MKQNANVSRILKSVISYILLIFLAISALYPSLWIVMSSFKEGDSTSSATLIPDKMTLQHYRDLFMDEDEYLIAEAERKGSNVEIVKQSQEKKRLDCEKKEIGLDKKKDELSSANEKTKEMLSKQIDALEKDIERSCNFTSRYLKFFANSLKISSISTVIGVCLVTITAYALSRFRFNGRQTILGAFMIFGFFPGFMAIIAIKIMLMNIDLYQSIWGVVLIYSAGAPVGVFVAKGFFDAIPKALEEAAMIDGASHMRTFLTIILPLARPMVTYTALMTFTGTFVDFIFPKYMLNQENTTIAVYLYDMVSQQTSTKFTTFAAGSVLVAIPITLLFMFLQRFLVAGLTSGATKG